MIQPTKYSGRILTAAFQIARAIVLEDALGQMEPKVASFQPGEWTQESTAIFRFDSPCLQGANSRALLPPEQGSDLSLFSAN